MAATYAELTASYGSVTAKATLQFVTFVTVAAA